MKDGLKKAWRWLWHDDSIWAWLANLAVAFIIIKWVVYPLAGLIFGTSLPVVAVVSESMDQTPVDGMLCGQSVQENIDYWDTCGSWYEERGISREAFEDFPLHNGFKKGDIVFLKGADPGEVEVGDVLVYEAIKPYPIIHRVVEITEEPVFVTKGDHNDRQISEYALSDGRYLYRCYQEIQGAVHPSQCGPGTNLVTSETPRAIKMLDEKRIEGDEIIGVAYGKLPWLGWVKILFVDLLELLGIGGGTQVI